MQSIDRKSGKDSITFELDAGKTADEVLAKTGIDLVESDDTSLAAINELLGSNKLAFEFFWVVYQANGGVLSRDEIRGDTKPIDIRGAVMDEIVFFIRGEISPELAAQVEAARGMVSQSSDLICQTLLNPDTTKLMMETMKEQMDETLQQDMVGAFRKQVTKIRTALKEGEFEVADQEEPTPITLQDT